MQEGHGRRIERKAGLEGLVEALSQKLSPGDLQSLLLEVYARRNPSANQRARQLLEHHQKSRFTQPAAVCARRLNQLEGLAYSHLPGEFEPLVLSPLAPLGACSGLASVHQNKVVSTVRNLEVSADPANQLALECALRRRAGEPARLAAHQRVVRAQALPPGPSFAHFSLFALATAERAVRSFWHQSLVQHLSFYLAFLGQAFPQGQTRVALTPLQGPPWSGVLETLSGPFPRTILKLDPDRISGRGYYQVACFKIYLDDLEIGDGGFTDWTAALLSDRREGLLTSGISLERLALLSRGS